MYFQQSLKLCTDVQHYRVVVLVIGNLARISSDRDSVILIKTMFITFNPDIKVC